MSKFCKTCSYSDRTCELGVQCCTVHHTKEEILMEYRRLLSENGKLKEKIKRLKNKR